nr:hypothetical transcript [Hymenolepis microstoma]
MFSNMDSSDNNSIRHKSAVKNRNDARVQENLGCRSEVVIRQQVLLRQKNSPFTCPHYRFGLSLQVSPLVGGERFIT